MAHLDRIRDIFSPLEFAWISGMTFRGLSISPAPKGWKLILRATHKTKGCLYLYVESESPEDCLKTAYKIICSKGGVSHFNVDKYST